MHFLKLRPMLIFIFTLKHKPTGLEQFIRFKINLCIVKYKEGRHRPLASPKSPYSSLLEDYAEVLSRTKLGSDKLSVLIIDDTVRKRNKCFPFSGK